MSQHPVKGPSQKRRTSRQELFATEYLVTHNVGHGEAGMRLDRFLKVRYSRRSREQIQKAIETGAITVHRPAVHATVGKLKPSTALILNDEVRVLSARKPEPAVNFNYSVLFEDATLFVILKPPNLPVHPAGRFFFNTLIIHLKTKGFTQPLHADREFYLVHRIDRETSGILVLSKDREVCSHLTKQFAARQTEKRYLAITRGRIEKDEFQVDVALGRDPHSRLALRTAAVRVEDGGYPASTFFRVLHRKDAYTLVECFPKTGRQHQIRVHLELQGHPIVGDKIYGLDDAAATEYYDRKSSNYFRQLREAGARKPKKDLVIEKIPEEENTEIPANFVSAGDPDLLPEADLIEDDPNFPAELQARLEIPRHALHAAGLRFEHPITGKTLQFNCGLPPDLEEFYWSQPGPGPETLKASLWGDSVSRPSGEPVE